MHTLRRPTLDDAAVIIRLNELAGDTVTPLDREELRSLLALSHRHLVALDDAGVVAAYLLALDAHAGYDGEEFEEFRQRLNRPFVYVDQVVVHPVERGRGLGRRLYGAVESRARRDGIVTLCCEVHTHPPNPGSATFHRKLGFRSVGRFDTRDGRTVDLMVRDSSDGVAG